MDFIAIDFETANKSRSSICSIGVAIVEKGKLVGTEHFYVKPTPNYYESFYSNLHGISDKKTKNEKTFKQQWEALKQYFDKQTVIAHNASFDFSILRHTLDEGKLAYPNLDYYCTLRLSQASLELSSHKLNDISDYFNIKLKHHNAESDAKASALIALKLCDKFKVSSLEELSNSFGFKTGKIISETRSYKAFSNKGSGRNVSRTKKELNFEEPSKVLNLSTKELFPLEHIKLSQLLEQMEETIQSRFDREYFWITARTINVKKYESNRRCYLTLEEVENGIKIAEIGAVFWANYYHEIENFEKLTKQSFKDGTEIICKVRVRYHKIYGLNLDVIQLDIAHTLGLLELEKQKVLDQLLKENPKIIQFFDGIYNTLNNCLPIPRIISNIALITASNSDGQRDFLQELKTNKHEYTFSIREYLTMMQGDTASKQILDLLKQIEKDKDKYDVVAIVRGGGPETDFKPFNDYELAKCVANFPIPIFTGIGHDRNQSIVDLMAREEKTPTKVASTFVEQNLKFENILIELKRSFFELVQEQLDEAEENLNNAKRIVKLSNPQAILNRGFAIVASANKIIVDPKKITEGTELQILLKNEIIHSIVSKKMKK